MTNTLAKYRDAERQAEERLTEFDYANPADLRRELALARQLLADSVAKGHASLANSLLVTIAKLSHEMTEQRIKAGELLPRDTVLRIAHKLADVTIAEMRAFAAVKECD
jgi:hypothetical protein